MGGGCYATTTQFRWEMGKAMRSLMGVGKRRRLRVDQPAILDELTKLTQFLWEMREAMRSLKGVGKKRRLRVDQPAILDELTKLAACTSGPNVCRGRSALASAPICLIRHVGWNKLSRGVSREASVRLLRALKKRGSRPCSM